MSTTGLQPISDARLRPTSPWRPALLAWQLPLALLLAALAVAARGPEPALLGAVYLAAVTPELCRVDLGEHRLPDALTLPGGVVALAGVGIAGATGASAVPALASGAAALALFLVLAVVGGMGLGDVKLAGVLGLAVGAAGAEAALLALVVAFLSGGIGALLVLARSGRRARLPFGPFLLAGFWVALVAA